MEKYMDKKTQKTIRNRVVRMAWEELKSEITMKDLAEALNIPLTTFFRIVNKGRQRSDYKSKK